MILRRLALLCGKQESFDNERDDERDDERDNEWKARPAVRLLHSETTFLTTKSTKHTKEGTDHFKHLNILPSIAFVIFVSFVVSNPGREQSSPLRG